MIATALPPAFDRPFRDTVRDVLRRAYEAAERYYKPADGADAMVHGIVVYKNANLQFRRIFQTGRIEHVTTANGAELHAGALRVRWNKVGRTPAEPIDESMPRQSTVITAMAIQNVQLELPFTGTDRVALRAASVNWVIAHIGTPQGGLQQIFLAAPITNGSAQAIGWRECVAIYDSAHPTEDLPEVGKLAEAVPLDDITLEFKNVDEAVADEPTDDEAAGTADAQ